MLLNRMYSLKDKLRDKALAEAAVAELAEEKIRPKAKILKGQKVGNKKLKK